MAITGIADVDEHIQEVWSKLLIIAREKNLIWGTLFDRRYEAETSGVPTDTIRVPGVDNWSTAAVSYAIEGEAITYVDGDEAVPANVTIGGTMTDTDATTPYRHFYFAFEVAKNAQLFTDPGLVSALTDKAGYHVSLEFDTYLAGFADAFSNSVGTINVTLEDDDIIEATRILNSANVPFGDRAFVFSEHQDAEFKKVERYTNKDYASAVGELKTARERGYIGTIHGLDWYTTTNVEANGSGHENAIFHKEVVAVVQKDKMRTEGPFYDITNDSDQYAVHNIYTAQEMRDDHGVLANGK